MAVCLQGLDTLAACAAANAALRNEVKAAAIKADREKTVERVAAVVGAQGHQLSVWSQLEVRAN